MTDTISTNNELLDAIMDHDVIIFTKARCVQCDQTKIIMRKNGINFHEMNLENENIRLTDQRYKTAYEFVTQTLGAQAAPIVLVKNDRLATKISAFAYMDHSFWSGFRPDLIKAIQPDIENNTQQQKEDERHGLLRTPCHAN